MLKNTFNDDVNINLEGIGKGWLVRFNTPDSISKNSNYPNKRDIILPDAYNQQFAEGSPKVLLFFRHTQNLGVYFDIVEKRPEGIWVEFKIPDKYKVDGTAIWETFKDMHNGIVKPALSVGHYVLEDYIEGDFRFIKKAYMKEGSIVPNPLNPDTLIVETKSTDNEIDKMIQEMETKNQCEKVFKIYGGKMSRKQRKTFMYKSSSIWNKSLETKNAPPIANNENMVLKEFASAIVDCTRESSVIAEPPINRHAKAGKIDLTKIIELLNIK